MNEGRPREAHPDSPATAELLGFASQLIRESGRGALATTSHEGAICGSIVRVVEGEDGAPIFLLRPLAEQVRHLERDPRASLLVVSDLTAVPAPDIRLTLVGTAAPMVLVDGEAGFRLDVLRIHFTSPSRSAWFRVGAPRQAQRA